MIVFMLEGKFPADKELLSQIQLKMLKVLKL